MFGKDAANCTPVLYGGSANAQNATEILSIDSVDGLLVGHASLIAPEFAAMVEAAAAVSKKENTNG